MDTNSPHNVIMEIAARSALAYVLPLEEFV
jgi:hypothetical protein